MAHHSPVVSTGQRVSALVPAEFEIRERFHVFVLLLAPLLVFIGGLWLTTSPHDSGVAQSFLNAFGGLFLCIGALFAYAVVLVRRVMREAPLLARTAAYTRLLTPSEKVARLAVLFLLFGLSWVAQLLYGLAGNVLFQACMIVFGMLSVTLTAHFHAHQ